METPETSNRVTIIVFVMVVLALVGSGGLLIVTQPDPVQFTLNPPLPTATELPTSTPAPIMVYVTGAVDQPELLVSLPQNSRVLDAIEAAGGTLDNADMERVNLADLLRDGDQVHVPLLAQVQAEVGAGIVDVDLAVDEALALPTPAQPVLINVNTATIEELITLPRIGQVTAERIVAYREENGNFTSLESLGNVSGIGDGTLEGLAPFVVFE